MAEKPMLGGCCVCLDERGWAENPLVYCDGQSCNVAVHQACYGIVKVPSGPWFCRKCESQERAAKVKCELCPHRDGALKRTDNAGWAHVVCALYIPEVTFGSVSSMEPIILLKVPPDRYNKTCYLCEEESRSSKASTGACMTCAKQGCKASFHVTCAQMSGLLCEEASGGNQTKYCGYCKSHLTKGKKMSSSYKSLSCAKVYKLPTTSSSDELGSPERSIPLLPNTMKPGDIRYTKAGKKRSKSLEESLATDEIENKVSSSVDSSEEVSEGNSSQEPVTNSPQSPPPSSKDPLTIANLQSSPVPVVSVEQLVIKSSVQSLNTADPESVPNNAITSTNVNENSDEKMDTSTYEASEHSNVLASTITEIPSQIPTENMKISSSTLTLSSLAEAASAISQSSAAEAEEVGQSSAKGEINKKKMKSTNKDTAGKKKQKEKKAKIKKTSDSSKKGESASKSKKKTKVSGVVAHLPIPPSLTMKDPATEAGTAIYPRHSVVTLANIGGRSETYGPHEIGENNKIFKPDFTYDGVTALEQFQEEQKSDSLEFFRNYGTTPDVAALMDALHKVREDNRNMQSAIEQMARRRDQLLLIKTRLMGLQTNNNMSTTITTTSNNSTQRNTSMSHQAQTPTLPSRTVASSRTVIPPQSSTPSAAQQTHQLQYAVPHNLNYSQMPPYPYPPVNTSK
uniref:protein AF-10-like n=1 Tax=Styela clava TaxID=7725 RepID=UPI00193ABB91|nr:protein AF-10-like [Styela clava]